MSDGNLKTDLKITPKDPLFSPQEYIISLDYQKLGQDKKKTQKSGRKFNNFQFIFALGINKTLLLLCSLDPRLYKSIDRACAICTIV